MSDVRDRRKMARHQRVLIGAFLLTCCATGLRSQATDSGSRFSFPGILASSTADGGIGIFNPNTADATVSLALTGSNGQSVGDAVSVTVPALGQIARTATQLFGTSLTPDTSLQVTSTTPGLVVQYQTFDSRGIFMDGAGAPEAALNLVFPIIPAVAPDQTFLGFLNSGSRNAVVQLTLFAANGTVLGQNTVQVVRGGTLRQSLAAAFPNAGSITAASHVTAVSRSSSLFFQPQPISGTSIFSGNARPSDIAAVNAVPVTSAFNAGVIPFFHVSQNDSAVVSIANLEPAQVDVNLSAIGMDGNSIGTSRITLPANGGFREPLESIFSVLGSGDRKGWILVQASGRIAASILEGRRDEGALSAVPMQKTPQYQFVFPQAVQAGDFSTELSLANAGPYTAYADLWVVAPDGVTLAGNQVVLPPGKGISQTLDKYIPELDEVPQGVVYVRSNEPLFGSESIGSASGAILSAIGPQAVPGSYAPAPLKVFAVTGKVTVNDRPVDGFPVVLSGATSATQTTATDGSYIFKGLPGGSYSLRVDQYGFEFIPPKVDFELKTYSKRQDFQGYTSANSILVRPASIPAGSPDVTLDVFGRGFNASSKAYVGTVALDTTLVDATRLRVVLPAFLVENAGNFDIRIVTDGVESNPFHVVAFRADPVLSLVTTAREIVEGSPAAEVTLNGSGFLPGASVSINGRTDGIEVSRLTDSEIVLVVPATYFTAGGVYPVVVENPYPGGAKSNIQLLTVYFPRPAIESISPAIVPARMEDGAGPLELHVFGYGFRRGAVVRVDDKPVATYSCEVTPACSSEHLVATVDASFLRESGFLTISVHNPDPSLEGSQVEVLRVESLQPTITSVTPGNATVLPPSDASGMAAGPGYLLPLVVFGTNFDPKVKVLATSGAAACTDLTYHSATRVISSNQLVYKVPVSYECIGPWTVEVMNPQPGGAVSKPAQFNLTAGNFAANPFLISVTPNSVVSGGPAFTVVIDGTNFQQGSKAYWFSTPLVTTFVSATQLRADIPASYIQTPGKRPIMVINPDNGGASNKLFIEVQ